MSQITAGELAAGDRLPTVRALAEELGLQSRVTFAGEASGEALEAL